MPLNKRRAAPYLAQVRSYTAEDALRASRLRGRDGCGSWRNFEAAHLAAQGGSPTTLLQDDFSEADGTALSGKALDVGGAWVAHSGAHGVAGGKVAQFSGSVRLNLSTADAGRYDFTAQVKITHDTAAQRDQGLVFRFSGTNDYWRVELYSSGADAFALRKIQGGVGTLVSSASVALVNGQTYTVRVVCGGGSITATLDGGNPISGSDTFNATATRCGIRSTTDASFLAGNTKFDDFLVTT